MYRRSLLGVSGMVLVSGLPGCTEWLSGDEMYQPTLPAGLDVEQRHWLEFVLVEEWGFGTDGQTSSVYTLLTDQKTAENRIEAGSALDSQFLDETDFKNSFLVVIETRGSGEDWLRVDEVKRRNSALQLYIEWGAEGITTDDFVPHSLVIRITDDEIDSSDEVTVYLRETPIEPTET